MKENESQSIVQLQHQVVEEIEKFKINQNRLHPYDLAELLIQLRDLDFDTYTQVIKKIPSVFLAEILAEMPIYVQEEVGEYVSTKKLVNVTSNMDTDDAASFIQNLSEENHEVAQDILENLESEDKAIITQLISYEDDEAGAYMQSELYRATIDENIGQSIKALKDLKESGELDNIWHCHLTNSDGEYLGSIGLEELIIFDHQQKFSNIPKEKLKYFSATHKQNIKEVIESVTNYNLTSLPIVDDWGRLIGRITSDDIYDIIQESATEQIYNMAGVNEEAEQEESIFQIGKSRAFWLGINLLTAIAASVVIGLFDATIQSLVALAVLMPIVASMGGNAGTQTLTVTVRQMALGDIVPEDAKKIIYKEVIISLVNGVFYAGVIGIIAFLWFKMPLLGVVIALSMVVNLLSAGFFGAIIPLILQKLRIDPAVGSTVILTTVTDIVGFLSFLGLATIILL